MIRHRDELGDPNFNVTVSAMGIVLRLCRYKIIIYKLLVYIM